MTDEPLVSILMNCYNGERFLREAVQSILDQSYQNWELIFWDNQSTDQSAIIFKSFNDKRLKYYYSSKHTLLYEARNLAYEKTLGNFIAFLDVDDFWKNNKLEKQMKIFSEDPSVAMVYSNYYFKNEIKNTNKIQYKKKLPEGNITDILLKDYVVALLTMIINMKFITHKHKIFDSKLHNIGDFDIAVKISLNNKVACIQSPLATYRWHGKNETILTREGHIKELETWGKEMLNIPEICSKDGFKEFQNKNIYLKGMLYVVKGDLLSAFKQLLRLSFGKEKFKLLLSILLPLNILKKLRT